MIITKTPFRISFFGGGTDYPLWFKEYGGSVLVSSINKYCYISCRVLPPFFEHKHRVVYSNIESVQDIQDIKHPSVRACLSYIDLDDKGYEIHHDGDLPARSGLGSSSAFTVGLLNALYGIKGEMKSKHNLASEAIYVEQEVIKENVGSQDQISTAYGGLNRIQFHQAGSFDVDPILLSDDRRRELNGHLMLFFTGVTRFASEVAKSKIENFKNRTKELMRMQEMVNEAIDLLQDKNESICSFGELLHESWMLKRMLSDQVATSKIDEIYAKAKDAGAIGGKILGAGGGGFLLLFVEPDNQKLIRDVLSDLTYVPFEFEDSGSRVFIYQPSDL